MERLEKLFRNHYGREAVSIVPLPSSGSHRRYFRISNGEGTLIGVIGTDPDENRAFVWDFDNSDEYEPNDILAGDAHDSLYLKPSCFQTGIT